MFIKRGRPNVDAEKRKFMVTKPFKTDAKSTSDFYKSKTLSQINSSTVDGIYTWILKARLPGARETRPEMSKPLFLAAPVTGNQEVGSLHINLDMWLESEDTFHVVAAGELRKSGDAVEFNLKSGTYMENVAVSEEERDHLVSLASSAFEQIMPDIRTLFLLCGPSRAISCRTNYEMHSGLDIINEKDTTIVSSSDTVKEYNDWFTLEYEEENEEDEDEEDWDAFNFEASMAGGSSESPRRLRHRTVLKKNTGRKEASSPRKSRSQRPRPRPRSRSSSRSSSRPSQVKTEIQAQARTQPKKRRAASNLLEACTSGKSSSKMRHV